MGGTGEDKTWLLAAHLSGLASFVVPFGQILGPLLVWQLKKSELPAVGEQAKEALNFQITFSAFVYVLMAVWIVVHFGMMMAMAPHGSMGAFGLSFLLFGLIAVVELCRLGLTVWGAVQASRGCEVRYPLTLRMVR